MPTTILASLRVTEKCTIITNILHAVVHLQLEVCKVVRIYLNISQIKIIIITFRITSNPFQHEVCQTTKDQIIPKHQICCRNNILLRFIAALKACAV